MAVAQPIPYTSVNSSWIQGLRWTPDRGGVMRVRKTGKAYDYPGMDRNMVREWLSRVSKGKWWWGHVGHPAREGSFGPVQNALSEESMHSWVAPSGQIHPTKGLTHSNWLSQNDPAIGGKLGTPDQAFRNGWGRVYYAGNKLYVHKTGPINEYQKQSLVNVALQNGLSHVIHDYDDDERVLWSAHDQLTRYGYPIHLSKWTGPTHPLFTPAVDGPVDFGSFTDHQRILPWLKSQLSPHATMEHLAALTGWLPGTKLHGFFHQQAPGQKIPSTLNTQISDPDGHYLADRSITIQPGKPPLFHNDNMSIPTTQGSMYRGVSGSVLLRQMRAAYELGIPKINFYAAFSEPVSQIHRPSLQAMFPGINWATLGQSQRKEYTGGLHWPLMGADGFLAPHYIKTVPKEIVEAADLASKGRFAQTRKLSDFFTSPEARDYYLEHPTSHDAFVDTTPGSYSRRQIERHVAEKALAHGQTPPIPDTMMPKKPLHLARTKRYPFHIEHLIRTGSLHPAFFDQYFCDG